MSVYYACDTHLLRVDKYAVAYGKLCGISNAFWVYIDIYRPFIYG